MPSPSIADHIKFNFDKILGQNILFSTISYEYYDTLLNIIDDTLYYELRENHFSAKLERNNFTSNKILMIICVKDNHKLLDHILQKLYAFHTNKYCDILVVDDRSLSSEILNVADNYGASYLRVENAGNIFNYSVLNNIAASYAKVLNKDKIIFYNNDVWPDNASTIPNLLAKHDIYHADISGCKLVYPSKQDYDLLANNTHLLIDHLDKIVNTIQHGGIYFFSKMSSYIDKRRYFLDPSFVLGPIHLWRFYNKNSIGASQDGPCYAVTGAFQIVNVDSFFKIGGLNQGLSCAFQDIDICINAIKEKMRVYYFGSEFLYHAESLTIAKDKINQSPKHKSDDILWDYLWGQSLPDILGYQKCFM